jgi:Tfp pilus assembly protein PilO
MEEKLNNLSFKSAAVFGLILAGVYYFTLYKEQDPRLQISRMNQDISIVKAEIAKHDRQLKISQEAQREILLIKEKADAVYKELPSQLTPTQAAGILSQEARKVGLSIRSISPAGRWTDSQNLSSIEINVQVTGSFSQIMIFLSELTRGNRVYAIQNLTISNVGAGSSRGLLTFNGKVKAYKVLNKSLESGLGGA